MKPGHKFIWIKCAALCLGLSTCGPLVELPGSEPAAQIFTLSHNKGVTGPYVEPQARLFIEEPIADGLLSNTRIAVRISETEVQYLPLARWSERPGHLLRASVHDSLNSISGLTALSVGALEVPADYRLKLRIRTFNAVEAGGELTSKVTLSAILLSAVGSDILAAHDFNAERPVNGNSASAIVKALDAAQLDTVEELSVWVAKILMGDAATS